MRVQTKLMENGKTVGEILLDTLLEQQMITEGFHKKTNSQMLLESTNTRDTVYYRGRPIERDVFASVYSNVRDYQTYMDIARVFGWNPEDFGEDDKRRKEVARKFINRTVAAFNKTKNPEDEMFPKFHQRRDYYLGDGQDDADFNASIERIDGGRKNKSDRTSRTVEKINSQDILDGEFYSNRTRIPKTRWGGWLKFWERKKTSVARDTSLLGREWGKSFIIGYQVSQNILYEIWYNSIDSTFTVHDGRGGEMSGRVKTMTEAIKTLVGMVAQTSSADAEVFRGSTAEARQQAQSIQRALYTDLDKRADELQSIDQKKEKQAKAEARADRMAKKKVKQKIKNMEKVRFEPKEIHDDQNQEDPTPNRDERVKARKNEPNEKMRKKADARMREDETAYQRKQDELKSQQDRIKSYADDITFSGEDQDDDFGVDVPEFVSAKDRREIEKQRKQRDKERKAAKKNSEKARKEPESSDERKKDIEKQIKDARERIRREDSPSDETVNESVDNDESVEDFMDDVESTVNSKTYDRQVDAVKKQAENSPYTQAALSSSVGDLISIYDDTKAKPSTLKSLYDALTGNAFMNIPFIGRIRRGRSEKINIPSSGQSVWKSFKNALVGTRYRSDFVIGFSLANSVNIEIWYVTEPNPNYDGEQNRQKTISSFYVYDVKAAKAIRQYLPYYRNAIQVVMAKLNPLL